MSVKLYIPHYKYQVQLTEIITGESKTMTFQAPFRYKMAEVLLKDMFSDSEYRLNSVTDVTGIVKIMIDPFCLN